LAGEKLLQHGADFRYVYDTDLPNDLQVDVGVVAA